jgi:hypothetical protein
MVRSVTFTASEADVLGAQRLHMSVTNIVRSAFIVAAFLAALATFAMVFGGAAAGDQNGLRSVVVTDTLIVAGLITCYVVYLNFGLPRTVKKYYAEQKTLRDEYTVTWSEAGVIITTSSSRMEHSWSDFLRWAQNNQLVLLYQSSRGFNILAKRAFSPEQLDDFTGHLTRRDMRELGRFATLKWS